MNSQNPCPCGSGRSASGCCVPFIAGDRMAPTAETLMRSRYTAYVRGDEDYLLATWHPSTRPAALHLSQASMHKWLGLKVLEVWKGGTGDGEGTVTFVARFKVGGRAERLHEVSRFVNEAGQWYYVDGIFEPSNDRDAGRSASRLR